MFYSLTKRSVGIGLGLAVLFSLTLGALLIAPSSAFADTVPDPDPPLGELTADDLLSSDFGDTTGLGQEDLDTTIAQLIRVVLAFLGVIAVIIVLIGGFQWMTAGGSDERVAEAKKRLIAGVIGLAIILAAYAITSFVVSSLISATQ